MFCSHCGAELENDAKVCSQCGHPVADKGQTRKPSAASRIRKINIEDTDESQVDHRPSAGIHPTNDMTEQLPDLSEVELGEGVSGSSIGQNTLNLNEVVRAARSTDAVSADTVKLDAVSKDTVKLDAVSKDTVKLDAVSTDTVKLDAVNADTVRLDAATQDTVILNALDFDTVSLDGLDLNSMDLDADDTESGLEDDTDGIDEAPVRAETVKGGRRGNVGGSNNAGASNNKRTQNRKRSSKSSGKGKGSGSGVWAAVGALLVLAVIVGAIVFMLRNKVSGPNYSDMILSGNQYLTEGSYDQAAELFNKAVEAFPKKPEGYLGLADVYIARNDEAKAARILEDGYDRTHSGELKQRLDELQGKNAPETNKQTETPPQTQPQAQSQTQPQTQSQSMGEIE